VILFVQLTCNYLVQQGIKKLFNGINYLAVHRNELPCNRWAWERSGALLGKVQAAPSCGGPDY
jgi:hypothetical protein